MKTHKDLDVWKNSIELVTEIYRISKEFPKDEMYGLTSQIRRAAVSVPSNIAEGAARKNENEFIYFLFISRGSLAELETQITIALNLNYLNQSVFDAVSSKIIIVRKQLSGLINHLKRKKTNNLTDHRLPITDHLKLIKN